MQHIFDTNHTAAARNTQTLGGKPMKSSENLLKHKCGGGLPAQGFTSYLSELVSMATVSYIQDYDGSKRVSLSRMLFCIPTQLW